METLTRELLPTLLHELANATQLLTGLHALMTLPGGDELLATREEDLGRAAEETHRLGWLLGVLGAASGHDTLLSRREAEGLTWVRGLVEKACRKADHELGPGPEALPGLRGDLPDAWSCAWTFGAALASQPKGGNWGLEEADGGLAWRGSRIDDRFLTDRPHRLDTEFLTESGTFFLPSRFIRTP